MEEKRKSFSLSGMNINLSLTKKFQEHKSWGGLMDPRSMAQR
jgi:hypothetical protein